MERTSLPAWHLRGVSFPHSSETGIVRLASHWGAILRSIDDRHKIRGGGVLSDMVNLLCLFLPGFGDMLPSKAGGAPVKDASQSGVPVRLSVIKMTPESMDSGDRSPEGRSSG